MTTRAGERERGRGTDEEIPAANLPLWPSPSLPLFLCLLLFSCARESPPPTQAASGDQGPPSAPCQYTGPLDTVRLVHQCRREGRTTALAEFLLPDQAGAVIEHLLAVDELTSANASLTGRVGARVGAGSAAALDRAAVANMVGPFSRDVEALSESINGDDAVVSIRVAGRLPLEEVLLVRRERCWRVQTDPPIPGLSAELRKLARATNQVVGDLERHNLSADQVEKELALRQGPILERIDALVRKAQSN